MSVESERSEPPWPMRASRYRRGAQRYVQAASGTEDPSEWREPRGYIKLMSSDLLEIPLWDEVGILTTDPDYLTNMLRLSSELAFDLIEWGMAFEAKPHEISWQAYQERGEELAKRLREEVASRFTVRTGPFA